MASILSTSFPDKTSAQCEKHSSAHRETSELKFADTGS